MARLIGRVTKVDTDGSEHHHLDDGPSKFNLMLAVFGSRNQRPPIHFRSQTGKPFDVRRLCVGDADDSGELFSFDGYLLDGRRVEGRFATSDRTGWIRIAPQGADRSFFYTKGGK